MRDKGKGAAAASCLDGDGGVGATGGAHDNGNELDKDH